MATSRRVLAPDPRVEAPVAWYSALALPTGQQPGVWVGLGPGVNYELTAHV